MPSRQSRCCAGVEPLLFARHPSKNPPPSPSRRASALAEGFPFGGPMHVYSAHCFFPRFSRLKLSAPLVDASSSHPEFFSQLIDALASPLTLYGHALELPGISLPSLHSSFLSRRVCPSRVCQFKGSLQSSRLLRAPDLMKFVRQHCEYAMGSLFVPEEGVSTSVRDTVGRSFDAAKRSISSSRPIGSIDPISMGNRDRVNIVKG